MFKMLTHVVLERNRGTDSIYPEPRDSHPPEQNITLGRHCCADTLAVPAAFKIRERSKR